MSHFAAVAIEQHTQVARDTWRLRLACPEIAESVVPGQFVMLRIAGCDDPLIGRPLALWRVVRGEAGEPRGIEVVYQVKGKFTRRLAGAAPGTRLEIWGPLGNGFAPRDVEQLVMVAGGIGHTPFLALARERLLGEVHGGRTAPRSRRVTMCYGARSAEWFAGVDELTSCGVEVRLSTDDGSLGRQGLVTQTLDEVLGADAARGSTHVVCCGPEPMMAAVADVAARHGVGCEVSLETPMACGIGICFTCVARVRQADGGWDYRRTCVEGPVFDAAQIEW